MIRDALFVDIPAIVAVIRDGYLRSHYAVDGNVGIDEREAKRLLFQAIQRHGGKHGGATFVQVAERDGVVEGFILGTLARVYGVGDKLMASDMFWIVTPRADAKDAAGLMRSMVKWAETCPDVVEIRCGTTAIINDDPKAAGMILERMGMRHYGEIYRMGMD